MALGFDQNAGDKRIFALSRIKNITIRQEKYTTPEGFDISKEVDLSFGIWHNDEEPEEYELLFDSNLANYILEREWHKDQIIEQRADGSVCLKFCSNQKQQIMSWVMSFGPAVEVVKPESLREAVCSNAEKVLGKYKF